MYVDQNDNEESEGCKEKDHDSEFDIETEINQEVTGMKKARRDALFVPVRIDIQCGSNTSLVSMVIPADRRKFYSSRLVRQWNPSPLFAGSVQTLWSQLAASSHVGY